MSFTIQSVRQWLQSNWFPVFAVIVYSFTSCYYMGPAFYQCNDSVYGFGDSTAGPIWRNSLSPPMPPLGGYEKSTNFPVGDNLYSPVGYVSLIQSVSMGEASKVVGPVCAYNLYNITSYLVTALVMCFFIYYLFKRKTLALIAGYAAAFSPYVQSKIGGHPSYGFGGVLVAIIWLAIHVLRYGQKRYAALLGGVIGICFYLDPYFVLLALTVCVGIAATYALIWVVQLMKKQTTFVRIRKTLWSFWPTVIVVAILIAPLMYVRIHDAKLIADTVGSVRGDIGQAATQCSNKPLDYLLPDPMNMVWRDVIGSHYTQDNIALRNWCGFGESRVGLSLTMLVTAVVGGILLYLLYIRQKADERYKFIKLPYSIKIIIAIAIAIGLIAFLMGLPPKMGPITTGSGVMIKLTSTWRIFAREYLLVNISLILLFTIVVHYILVRFPIFQKRSTQMLLLFVLFMGIVMDYQINEPFKPPTFTYSRDIPSVYHEVRNNPTISAIAEYPIDKMGIEYDSVSYYMTMQGFHKKPIFNSAANVDIRENIHMSMKDLADPQTIPALVYSGIGFVVIHGESRADIDRVLGNRVEFLKKDTPVVYGLTILRADDNPDVNLYRIKNPNSLSNILTYKSGYLTNLPLIQSPLNIQYETHSGAVLQLTPLGKEKMVDAEVCFDVKMSAPGDNGVLTVLRNDKLAATQKITDNYTAVRTTASSNDELKIVNDKGYNMRVDNLDAGCGGYAV